MVGRKYSQVILGFDFMCVGDFRKKKLLPIHVNEADLAAMSNVCNLGHTVKAFQTCFQHERLAICVV